MGKFFYGTFEAVIRSYVIPKITMLELANILLSSPKINAGAKLEDRNLERKTYAVDSSLVTRCCKGERGIPPRIREYFAIPEASEKISQCLSVDLLPRIEKGTEKTIVQEILSLLLEDGSLLPETQSYFTRIASEKPFSIFLAESLITAVDRKKDTLDTRKNSCEHATTNLPGKNVFFHGREDLIKKINEQFKDGIHMQGLYGMRGTGKTQLALQYAYNHLKEYDIVWWINAETKATLQGSACDFLSARKSLPENKDADSIRLAFLDYLDNHNRWLVIYDNAEYGTDAEYRTLLDYFPQNTNGNVLLTTCCRNAFEDAIHIEVGVFNMEEAVQFLEHRTGLFDYEGAANLAAQMGFLPLALEYAGAYIKETSGVNYQIYSKRLESYGIKVLDYKVGFQAYKNTVREAFHITMDKLLLHSDIDPVAGSAEQFLNICAFLAPDGIDLEIFTVYGTALPEPIKTVLQNDLERDELVRRLTSHSLVHMEWNTMSMHRLLQEVLRDETGETDTRLCINYAYGVFYKFILSIGKTSVKQESPIITAAIPHLQTLVRRYVQQGQRSRHGIPDSILVAKEYFSWTGHLLKDTKKLEGENLANQLNKNISILKDAMDFYDILPEKTVYPAYILMLLAQAYEGLSDMETAAVFYGRALSAADIAVELLPTDISAEQAGTLQDLYRTETFCLSSDISAAVGSSSITCIDVPLLWRGYVNLIKIAEKELLCPPHQENIANYQETIRYLTVYSQQIADYTGRAFILKLDMKESWLVAGKKQLVDCFYDFFFPSVDTNSALCIDALDGFDILLGDNNKTEATKALSACWTTLAFEKDIRSEDDMLTALTNIDAAGLSLPAKRSLYGMAYMLAKRLKYDSIMTDYKERLRKLSECFEKINNQSSNLEIH